VRRGCSAGRSPVFSGQDVLKTVGRSFGVADLHESADDRTDHVLEKAISIGMNDDSLFLARHRQLAKLADRIFIIGQCAFE
jgi:hypothetical protein